MTDLCWVATYHRTVSASLERVWENVLDWEHLPTLHASAFRSIECEDAGRWGWRATVGLPGPGESVSARIGIALTLEEPGDRYVVRTFDGPGKGTEIWTTVSGRSARETGIEVRFGVPDTPPEQADAIGQGYVGLYTRLWDEDESMMVGRERALERLRARGDEDRIDLGPGDALRGKAPLEIEARGRLFRVEEEAGRWRAYAITCPHMLGPLARQGEELRCPWHGYRFDPSSGRSCDGRGLSLAPAPRVELDADGHVLLLWEPRG